MKAIHFSLAGLVAVGAVSLLSGCDKTDSAQAAQSARVSKPVAGGALTWGVTTEPACFDPHRSSQQNAFWVIRNYIDSLISKKTDGTYAPWLAKSWSIADDGKSYTFNLRDDVHFTDGTPFNAAAVKTTSAPRPHPRRCWFTIPPRRAPSDEVVLQVDAIGKRYSRRGRGGAGGTRCGLSRATSLDTVGRTT